jgi:hypothetical protein
MQNRCLSDLKIGLFIADILLPEGVAFPAIDEAKRRNIPYLLIIGSVRHMAQREANGEFPISRSRSSSRTLWIPYWSALALETGIIET